MTRGVAGPLLRFIPAEFEGLLRSRDLRASQPTRGARQGFHASRRSGAGLEFREHRPYMAGDDLRRLDWKVAGRSDRLVIRQTRGDDERPLLFAIDRSAGMDYGEDRQNKWQVARALVATLSVLALSQGDRVGATFGGGEQVDSQQLRPRGDYEQVQGLVGALDKAPSPGACPWPEMLADILQHARSEAQVLLVSDFLDPASGDQSPEEGDTSVIAGARALKARGHAVCILQILHRHELELPWRDAETLKIEDPRGRRVELEGSAGQMREGYSKRVQAHLKALDLAAQREGIPLQRVVSDQDLETQALSLLSTLAGGDNRAGAPRNRA